ncbi:Gpi16 subunit, GPI transamidase component-domain-containing protein [Fomes fomentarius]|nr:Gpi16 subunit, GPI transamidase component-domain-containing protein [Fomes fomentarius]
MDWNSVLEGVREQFDEELDLHPLRDGKLAARFSFATLLKGSSPRDPQQLTEDGEALHPLFPLALGQILREYAVTELHLTLNAGKWNYDVWGYPDEPGVSTGAELWAWMGDSVPTSVDQRWQGHMDDQRTTSPVLTFEPEGTLPNFTHPQQFQFRHAILPTEHVCTENLTPFLKLLPCKSLSGIASLLNPHRLFDADWHGLGVHVRYREDAGAEIRQKFQAVFDPVRMSNEKRRDWSFGSVFDRSIERACPCTLPNGDLPYSVDPDPTTIADGVATYNATKSSEAPPLTEISICRNLKGTSQAEAQLTLVVTNNLRMQHLQFNLHTLHAHIDGTARDDLVSLVSYTPPVPHSRPALLQAVLTLPPGKTLHLTMDVVKPFLRCTEHQPDAQRCWDLPPAVLASPVLAGRTSHSRRPRRMYRPILVMDLATPDFSMPYNVIIMSCTLIALVFGSVFNFKVDEAIRRPPAVPEGYDGPARALDSAQ